MSKELFPDTTSGFGVTIQPCLSALLERGGPVTPGKPSVIVTRLLGEREPTNVLAGGSVVGPLKQHE